MIIKKDQQKYSTKKYHNKSSANMIIKNDHQTNQQKWSATMITKHDNKNKIYKITHQKIASTMASKHDHQK